MSLLVELHDGILDLMAELKQFLRFYTMCIQAQDIPLPHNLMLLDRFFAQFVNVGVLLYEERALDL